MDSSTLIAPGNYVLNVRLASPEVSIAFLEASLVGFLNEAGRIHNALFNLPLIVTSGNDGQHVPGSAHGKNEAADLRSHDLSDVEQLIFFLCMIRIQEKFGIVILDERYTHAPHWHVQTAESIGG
jgi:hypothetical protein